MDSINQKEPNHTYHYFTEFLETLQVKTRNYYKAAIIFRAISTVSPSFAKYITNCNTLVTKLCELSVNPVVFPLDKKKRRTAGRAVLPFFANKLILDNAGSGHFGRLRQAHNFEHGRREIRQLSVSAKL